MVRIVPPPRTKQLIKIAAPCVIEQFLLVLVGLISTAIIGHLGKTELTASSMSNTLVNCLQCFYTGLTAGATVVIGRLWGENDKDGVRRAFFQALVLTAFVSFAVLAFLLIFQSQIILLLFGKAEGDVMKNIHIYFPYCMIGMPATALTNAISASLRGTGDNKTALVTSVFLNALNVVLSYITEDVISESRRKFEEEQQQKALAKEKRAVKAAARKQAAAETCEKLKDNVLQAMKRKEKS